MVCNRFLLSLVTDVLNDAINNKNLLIYDRFKHKQS